jgi:lipid A disaccharide synthetase
VPELLQDEANAEGVARAAGRILGHRDTVNVMRARLAALRPRLGRPGASQRAAAEVLAVLEPEARAA